jgi:ribokinase
MASKDILVRGTLNLETTFPITGFPLDYEPACYRPFELRSRPSGVGFNIARALSTLGNRVLADGDTFYLATDLRRYNA